MVKIIAIVVIVVGVLMTVFTGFSIMTKKEVADIGPIEINKTEKTPVYWSPVTGLVLIGIGSVALIAFRKQ